MSSNCFINTYTNVPQWLSHDWQWHEHSDNLSAVLLTATGMRFRCEASWLVLQNAFAKLMKREQAQEESKWWICSARTCHPWSKPLPACRGLAGSPGLFSFWLMIWLRHLSRNTFFNRVIFVISAGFDYKVKIVFVICCHGGVSLISLKEKINMKRKAGTNHSFRKVKHVAVTHLL